MALVETCKCEECGLQKSFANHWVMIVERKDSLVVLPAWDEKRIRRTRHFCGRAHASRFVERWIANPGNALNTDVASEAESNRPGRLQISEMDLSNQMLMSPSPMETVETERQIEQRKLEQLIMEDEYGDEMSSARLISSPLSVSIRCA
jgi:hypothetical protein